MIQAARHCDQDSISMSLLSTTMDVGQGALDKLDPSSMYTVIKKSSSISITKNMP